MPQAASKKQYRFMMAILHSKDVKDHARGNPPKSIASKYSSPGDGAPESKDNDRGGTWGSSAHKKAKEKVKEERIRRKKEKKSKLKKSFEQYYNGQGAGVIAVNSKGQILVGEDAKTGLKCTPGGHVDPGENFEQTARRELLEEAGIKALNLFELGAFRSEGNDCKVFLTTDFAGKPKSKDGELNDLKWVDSHVLADQPMREASKQGLKIYLQSHLKKSDNQLQDLLALEKLEKNILRGPDGRTANYDMSHGDALRLVGNGVFRAIREAVNGMEDEGFRDLKFDNYTISIRKHLSDVYSGRINDGHKTIHQFTNRSLPQVCADLMSVFEWYLPEDEPDLEILSEDHLADDAIHGGLNELVNNYRKHNIAEIYQEVENIREEIRQGNAVDLMQVEANLMKLFDKLERFTSEIAAQHNSLCQESGDEIERLESKLLELQTKIDQLNSSPSTVEAYSYNPADSTKVHSDGYMYLSKPNVVISPDGRIKISFDKEWTGMDRENFLSDMRAKVIKKK